MNRSLDKGEHEERREEVKTYRVRSYHVGCGGEWLSQGEGITDWSSRWLHRCDKCTALIYLDRCFPTVEHS